MSKETIVKLCYENFIDEGFQLLKISTEDERKKYLDLANIRKETCSLTREKIYPEASKHISEDVDDAGLEPDIE
jgi:hypothetical protein